MAVDRVERLLRKLADALNAARVDYAIIGGNAVAAWVGTVDEGAVRATKDVDVLLRRPDLPEATTAAQGIGLTPVEVLGVHMFLDRRRPNPKTGVHIVFSGERVRPEYAHAAPDPAASRLGPDGFRLIDLSGLLAMKLQAYRFIDRAHVQDLLAVGLIDKNVRASLPPDLLERLQAIEDSPA